MTDIKTIENKFAELVDVISSQIEHGTRDEFEERDFEKFRPYITNWCTLIDAIDEDNEEGYSELWEEIEFSLPG
jgi:hypothetical protein